jgi:hypothetical protein
VKKLLLIGTVVLLSATSAQATFFAGPSGNGVAPCCGGGAFPAPNPNSPLSRCLRANGVSPALQDQRVGVAAVRRCIGKRR